MKDKYKIIVAHPGKQHSFRLASALKKNPDFQVTYITTVYNKKNSILMNIIKMFITNNNRQRAQDRNNSDFFDDEVIQFCYLGGLVEILFSRLNKKKNLYNYWHKRVSARFGIKVAKYAIRNKVDAVICYDTNAMECFSYLNKNAPHIVRIMDSAAANRLFMKKIYQQDIAENQRFSEKLEQEIGDSLKDERQDYYRKEMLYSQYLLVPSNFVKKSYQYSGVMLNNMELCPYGVEGHNFSYNPRKIKSNNQLIQFVFVGGTKQLKGISYLLDAFLQIPKDKAQLTIIGDCNLSEDILKIYKNHVNFAGRVLHSKVPEILQEMDVMIFPSLGDGFGLSAIEGMSCGCPLICSSNSGVADLINEGENGFIIPIQNVDSIIERVNWFIKNRDVIPYMGQKAHETASQYTWVRYEETIINIMKKFENQLVKEK